MASFQAITCTQEGKILEKDFQQPRLELKIKIAHRVIDYWERRNFFRAKLKTQKQCIYGLYRKGDAPFFVK